MDTRYMAAVTSEALTWVGFAWLGGSGETVKRLDSSNGSDKTAAVATATVRTGIDDDGVNNMTAMAAAQTCLVIRRRQQQDNGDCGSNGGGADLAWLGGSAKTARRQQNQKRDGSDSSDDGGADWNLWQCKWQWQRQAVQTWRGYSGKTLAARRQQRRQ